MAIKITFERRKGDRPETIDQARTWGRVKGHYLAAGLCAGCAGQAAYGHQLGFTRIKDPCTECRGLSLPARLIGSHGDRGQRWLRGHYRTTAEVAD